MLTPPSSHDRERFYGAAVAGLRALDQRERVPRRFGSDADARWAQFRGSLGPADRIDVLLRDAAGTWGAAFSPAQAFGLFGLSEDDPFGPDWQGISDERARRLPSEAADLASAARALGVTPSPVTLPPLTPATRVAVAGGSAIVALATEFARRPELAWSEQVVAVVATPAHRQLAALAAVFVGAGTRTPLVRPAADVPATLRAAGFPQVDVAVVSGDAEADAARFARAADGR